MEETMLTTSDNPFDPFEQFTSWFLFDVEKGYYTCAHLARLANITDEMTQKRYSNNIGAWYITLKVNKKGYLESIQALASPYYVTNKEDYIKSKVLHLTKGENK